MPTTNRIAPDRPPLPNGHAAQHTNSHADAQVDGPPGKSAPAAPITSMSPAAIAGAKISARRSRARAASDDAHVPSSGASANPAAAPPVASADRDAGAAAARDSNNGPIPEVAPQSSATPKPEKAKDDPAKPWPFLPPGKLPLPEDGATFVSNMHEQADIIEAGRRLLNSKDEKIIKGVWDRLVNLKSGNSEEQPDDESRRVIVGMPRPIRKPPQPPAPQQET